MKLSEINKPIDPDLFVKTFSTKFQKWGNAITNELKETWKQNCIVFNNVIANKENAFRYIVSAPTGSAKTENTITYCSMLSTDIKVLISTNLTDEADRIANDINNESKSQKAVSFHSKNKITLEKALSYQIIIVTHAFYKNYSTKQKDWKKITKNVDLVIIDEAINTMQESSLSINEVFIALNLFETLHRQLKKNNYKFKLNPLLNDDTHEYEEDNLLAFEIELERLFKDFEKISEDLTSPRLGTTLLRSDKKLHDDELNISFVMFTIPKYTNFTKILEEYKLPLNQLLTGIKDESLDLRIKNNVLSTLKKLSEFSNKQVYITSNNGEHTINRVKDYLPKQSIVCLDATSDVNEIYKLREMFHNDLILVPRIKNVRDYSTVNLYSKAMTTSKIKITENVLKEILNNITFGKKTLFVVNKKNIEPLEKLLKDYNKYETDIANWGAITGLNNWKDFDTCVILGLNHKPKQFSQNRSIFNTNEKTAFGENQDIINKDIEISDLVTEIIQAMNRIRIRQVINNEGKCQSANIYITLPTVNYTEYQSKIKKHMTNIKMFEWDLNLDDDNNEQTSNDKVINYLNTNLKAGDKINIYTPRDELEINKETYRSIIGKTSKEKNAFSEKLKKLGFEILEIMEIDERGRNRKKPTKYIYKY